jgi:hypothetical protein
VIERRSTHTEKAKALNFETNKSVSLDRWVKRFPTPLPSDVDGGRTTKGRKRQGETGLRRAVWPTPTSDDANNASLSSGDYQSLTREAGGQLNADWVSLLMGFPLGWTVVDGSAGCQESSRDSGLG